MGVLRRKKTADSLLQHAHIGGIANSHDILNLALQKGIRTQPLDVEALAKLLNIRIERSRDLDEKVSGSLKKIENEWLCTVNARHHPTRQRFTIAHEIAHYLLHKNEQEIFEDDIFFRNGTLNTIEFEANQFAADLLMPEGAISFYFDNVSQKLNEIAAHFNVSTQAADVRLRQLNLKALP